jgi:GNAT superfamily N-acetyltransferase
MSDIKIQQAITTNMIDIVPLFDQYRIFYGKSSDTSTAQQFLTERLENNEAIIFIAVDAANNKVVGFTLLYPLYSSTRMQRMWLLNDLFVIEEYRGTGISKMLIERAKELAIDTQSCGIQLETAKTNMIGNQLYPATGFELENDVNFYFWTNTIH